jgi:hypothetical protein
MTAAGHISAPIWMTLVIPAIAYAHIDGMTGQDYSGFERNDGKGSCCDWQDCRPASEPFMQQGGEKMIDRAGNVFSFDPGKVVKRPSDDGNWHVCGNATTLKCIIAPAETRREMRPLDRLFGWLPPEHAPDQGHPRRATRIALERAKSAICE